RESRSGGSAGGGARRSWCLHVLVNSVQVNGVQYSESHEGRTACTSRSRIGRRCGPPHPRRVVPVWAVQAAVGGRARGAAERALPPLREQADAARGARRPHPGGGTPRPLPRGQLV